MSAKRTILTALVLVTVAQWNASRPVWADAGARTQVKRCCAAAAPKPKGLSGDSTQTRAAA